MYTMFIFVFNFIVHQKQKTLLLSQVQWNLGGGGIFFKDKN